MSGGGGVPIHHEGGHSKEQKVIGLIIAIIAVVLSIATVLCKKAEIEEVICKIETSNTWAQYQAKKIRQSFLELTMDEMNVNKVVAAPEQQTKMTALADKYTKTIDRYKEEQDEIKTKAETFTHEGHLVGKQAKFYNFAEILLQISIIMCSITLLTESSIYSRAGIVLAILGSILTAYGFFSNPTWIEIFHHTASH